MRRRTLALGLLAAPVVHPARAQSRPVTLLHGFGPGGPADAMARLLAPGMAEALGVPVVVEPRPGAGGNIAAAAASRAAPDGQTLILLTGGHAVSAAFARGLNYDPVEGFAFVGAFIRYGFILGLRADHPARDLRSLLALAAAAPGAVQYGSAGTGSTQHLVGEMLNSHARVQMTHVPYRGDAASLAALLAGEVPLVVGTATTLGPHAETGAVRMLAASGATRSRRFPAVPTIAEAGLPGFEAGTWAGIAAPRGTPEPVVARAHAAVASAAAATGRRLEELVDGTVETLDPPATRALVVAEIARWGALIRERGITPE
jgi:tripartite-type tricarboxylate transporter receptor subunit TctC